ncbi:MAG TPA: hypothetical protein PKO06_15140 [Candidatus Ozemobacteraceae bacterium]|nr:hypothetical protein [Candidatus Ozemobacteraceae bacterium]
MTRLVLALVLVLVCCSFVSAAPNAAVNIKRDTVALVAECPATEVLTLRVQGRKAWLVCRNGDFWNVDLETGSVSERRSLAKPVVDAALLGEELIGLEGSGALLGKVPTHWTTAPVPAVRLESAGGDLLIVSDTESRYLAAPATQSIRLGPLPLAVPFRDGFLWSMSRQTGGRAWQIELLDMFGNRMKRLYRFSAEFDPTGTVMGPVGPEGEILISFYTGQTREFAAIGPHGRMLWRVPGSAPVCARDFAWSPTGGLLVLEAQGTGVAVTRWQFVTPEG